MLVTIKNLSSIDSVYINGEQFKQIKVSREAFRLIRQSKKNKLLTFGDILFMFSRTRGKFMYGHDEDGVKYVITY